MQLPHKQEAERDAHYLTLLSNNTHQAGSTTLAFSVDWLLDLLFEGYSF